MKQDVEKWRAMQKRARLKYMNKPKKKKRRTKRISKLTGKPIISRQKAERELWRVFSLFIRKRDGACVILSQRTVV